jgi:hypothetical protein
MGQHAMRLLPERQEARFALSRLCFFLAFIWFVLGFIIDFLPGTAHHYFALVACLFLFVFLISGGNEYRTAAAVFAFISVLFGFLFYGLHYQASHEHLRPRPAISRP